MHYAIELMHLNTVKLFLSYGVDINKPDSSGQTALHLAVSKGMVRMVKLLIENGSRYDIKDENGRTPMDLAKELHSTIHSG